MSCNRTGQGRGVSRRIRIPDLQRRQLKCIGVFAEVMDIRLKLSRLMRKLVLAMTIRMRWIPLVRWIPVF
ncbi:MAG: hypothetical protein OXI38_01580 [Bacteroidota bacterium]|nr:hypothetical protein [Bacteroidota bacterium]